MLKRANGRFDAERLDRILAGLEEPSSKEEAEVATLAKTLRALGEKALNQELASVGSERSRHIFN